MVIGTSVDVAEYMNEFGPALEGMERLLPYANDDDAWERLPDDKIAELKGLFMLLPTE